MCTWLILEQIWILTDSQRSYAWFRVKVRMYARQVELDNVCSAMGCRCERYIRACEKGEFYVS